MKIKIQSRWYFFVVFYFIQICFSNELISKPIYKSLNLNIKNNIENLEVFPRRNNIDFQTRFNSTISYNEGANSTGDFVFNQGDSLAVWFRPLTDCMVEGIEIYFPASTDLVGSEITVLLRRILPSTSLGIPANGAYNFSNYNITIGDFMGEVISSKQFNISQNHLEQAIEINFDNLVDIGNNDFAIQIVGDFGGDNPDIIYWDGVNGNSTNYNHGFKYYPDGASFCPEGCWVPRLNFGINAKVDYYGDHPPIISEIEDLSDFYYSCNNGSYTPSANIEDLGTDSFVGELTSVKFHYSNGTEEVVNELIGSDVNNTFSGYISEQPIGTEIAYWWEATDNAGNQIGVYENQTTIQRIPKKFRIIDYTPGADILVIDDGFYNTENSQIVNIYQNLNQLGFSSDYVNLKDSGVLSECAMDFYSHYMVLQGLNGAGNILPNSFLENYFILRMEEGADLFLSSVDYIYEIYGEGNGWEQTNENNHLFLANYLHVEEYWNDYNPNDLQVEYRGNDNNSITDDILEFNVESSYQNNYFDIVTPQYNSFEVFDFFDDSENSWSQHGGTMFSGYYKSVFFPWHFENIASENSMNSILLNIFDWMGVEHVPTIVEMNGPENVIFSTNPQQVTILVNDAENDEIIAKLFYSINNNPHVELEMTQIFENEFSVNIPGQSEGTEIEYYFSVGDESGFIQSEIIEYRIYESNSAVLLILSNDMNYGEMDFPAEYYTLDFENYLLTGEFNYFIEPDYWSIIKDGPTTMELINRYNTIIEITTTDDYDLYQYYDFHLARINEWLESGNKNYLIAGDETFALANGNWVDIQYSEDDLFYKLGIQETINDISWGGISELNPTPFDFLTDGISEHLSNDEILVYDPEDLIGYTNWMDGAIPTDEANVSILDNNGSAIILNREWNNGNKTVYMGIDPISIRNSLTNYWYGASEYGIIPQALDWFGEIILNIDNNIFEIPKQFKLYQNHPNPFNPITHINFDISEATNVKLTIYNLLGKTIKTLVNDKMVSGSYTKTWNGKNNQGIDVPSGVYFYRLSTNQFTKTNKMILLK